MSLYVLLSDHKPDRSCCGRLASRGDRLRADGWEECGTCEGKGYEEIRHVRAVPVHHPECDGSCQMCPIPEPVEEYERVGCDHCAHGLVPPEGMVEAAARHAFAETMEKVWGKPEISWAKNAYRDTWLVTARAALIAAARWEKPRQTGSCEDDCQDECAYPGEFSECEIGAEDE